MQFSIIRKSRKRIRAVQKAPVPVPGLLPGAAFARSGAEEGSETKGTLQAEPIPAGSSDAVWEAITALEDEMSRVHTVLPCTDPLSAPNPELLEVLRIRAERIVSNG